jgi:hypothetical protein
MDFVVVVAHWCVPNVAHPSTYKGPSYLRQLCVKSTEAFWYLPAKSGTTLNGLRLALGVVAPTTPISQPMCLGSRQPLNRILAMKTVRFVGHDAAREALVLSIAGVTAIMLIESLVLLILF